MWVVKILFLERGSRPVALPPSPLGAPLGGGAQNRYGLLGKVAASCDTHESVCGHMTGEVLPHSPFYCADRSQLSQVGLST